MAKRADGQGDLFAGDVVESGVPHPPARHVRDVDPPTSHAAAEAAEVSFTRHRYDTLRCYLGWGNTDDEAVAESARLFGDPWMHGTMSKRRHRLMEAGLIEARTTLTGRIDTRPTARGIPATVWHLTEEGYRAYVRWADEQEDR